MNRSSFNQASWKARLAFASALFVIASTFSAAAVGQSKRNTAPDEGLRFQPPSRAVLTGATVVVDSSTQHNQADVLIEDGKIVAIGKELEVPAGTDRIDCSGLYLYPAFVEAYAAAKTADFVPQAGYWNDQITPERHVSELLDADAVDHDALRKVGIAAYLAAPEGGLIKGRSCVVTTGSGALSERMLRDDGFLHMQLYPSRRSRGSYPNSPMGAVALVRQSLYDASWYEQAMRASRADRSLPAPEFNSSLQSLQDILRGDARVIIDGNNEMYALRADRLAREFSLNLVVRGSGREYRRLDAIADTNRTFIVPVDFPEAPDCSSEEAVASTTLQELMHWRLAPENPARLRSAGVEIVLTTDGLDKKDGFLPAIRKAIEHGLSEADALDALTSTPAKLLGVDYAIGSLETGKLANLIVADGPLFESKTKLLETWVEGERFAYRPTDKDELSGTWSIETNSEAVPAVQLVISGEPGKWKGELQMPEAEQDEPQEDEADEADEKGTDHSVAEDSVAEEAETEEGDHEDHKDNAKKSKPDRTTVKKLEFAANRLTGTFDATKLLDAPGTALLSVVLLQGSDDSSSSSMHGTIVLPDGRRVGFTAIAVTESDDEPSDKKNKDASDEGAENSDAENSDAEESKEFACDVNYPLGAFGVSEQPQQHEWLMFRNATIWTSGDAGVLQDADMLVHAGMIEAVGKDLELPEGAVEIDATGKHISPGIIDCHSHMATDGGVNESGQAITAEVRISDFIDPSDITIYRQLAGGVTTANILHGSANPIGGQNQVIKLRWGALGEEMKLDGAPQGIKFALGENVKQSNWGEGNNTRYPQTRMGVEQIMRDRFEAAKLYKQAWEKWTKSPSDIPPRRDLELDAIAEILDGERWVHCHSYRQDEILAMLRTLEAYNVTIGSLQHILEGYKVADAMAKHGAMGSSFSDWWAYKFEVYDAIPYNGALMHNAGVVVSFNSDDDELARHLNHEAAKAVKYGGIEPAEALKFVTLNPAKQLRIDHMVGKLEPGMHADFVLWNRSPLSTLSKCLETWIDGRKYFDYEEDLKARVTAEELHRNLVQSSLDGGKSASGGSNREDPSTWWARHDEFCHHKHGDHDHDALDHEHHEMSGAEASHEHAMGLEGRELE